MPRKQSRNSRIGQIEDVVAIARDYPYLQRLIEDRELRERLQGAYGAARSAYGRMNNGKPPAKALMEDRKLQRELSEAAKALKEVSNALRKGSSKKQAKSRRPRRAGRTLLIAVAGASLALIGSKGLRSKALDLIFGAEEEFNYSSTTAPREPAPQPAAPV